MPQFTQAQIEARTELSRKQFESGYNVVKNNRPMSYSASIRFLTPEDSNKYRYLYLIEGILGVIDNKTLALRTQTVVDILPIICGFMAAQGMKIGKGRAGMGRAVCRLPESVPRTGGRMGRMVQQ